MRDLSQDVVQTIKEKQLLPESRWRVLARSIVFWIMLGLTAIIGSIAFSLVIFNVVDIDVRFFRHMGFGKVFHMFFETAPYIWIAFFLGALVFGVVAFRKTRHGYRFRILFVTSVAVLAIGFFGVLGHMAHIGDRMLGFFGPSLRCMADARDERWVRPQDGLVAGEVMRVAGDAFGLRSFDGRNWTILIEDETEYIDNIELFTGERVGVIGKKIGDFSMKAFSVKVLPFEADNDRVGRLSEGDHRGNECFGKGKDMSSRNRP